MTRIARFLYAESGGYRLALFRILFAAFLLAYFGSLLPHVELLFSRDGVYSPYLVPDYAPPPIVAWILFASMLGASIALLLGKRAELAARVLLVLFLYHYFLQLAVKESSFDRLIAIDLLVLSFADAGRVFGLDAQRPGDAPNAWAERLLRFQTLILYFGSGLWKAFNPAWHDGALLHSTLEGMFASPLAFAIVRLDLSDHTWTLLSRAIVVFELALAPLLLWRRTRTLGLWLGAGFHLFNTVVLVIPEFLLVIATYPLFVDEDTVARRLRACARG